MKEVERIYQLYKDDIFKYLVNLTENPNLSEDLLSETFIRVIKSINKFRGDSTIKTWIFSIARYTWYDYLRKDKKELQIDDLISLYIGVDIEKDTINKLVTNRIIEILENENKRNRDIVIMKINGYSYYEIGIKHKISQSSARVINFRVKSKIKDILEEEGLDNE